MFALRALWRANRKSIQSKSNEHKARGAACVCEPIERRVLLNAATFAAPTSVSVSGARAPVVAARFHGTSGPFDLAVATSSAVQILNGSSGGTYSVGASIALPANSAADNPFQIGDYSGNGPDDLVLDSHNSGTGDGQITYETSNGDGTFTAGSVTNITDGGAGFTPIAGRSGDFNGDGDTDLAIIGKPGTGSQLVLAILLSNADGTFTEKADYPIVGSNASGNTSNEEVFTNITNEIIVYDGSGGNLDVFSGIGDGTFTQLTPTSLAASLIVIPTINGTQDIAVANGNQVSILVNQNDGTFQADPQGPITLGGTVTALGTGDFNLDGNADLITNQGILFGNGDGTFQTTPEALPVSVGGSGNYFSNTLPAVDILGNNRAGIVGISSSGNAIVSAVNTTLAPVSIDLESSNNPANPGADVQFTASVSAESSNITATPTGEVTFFNGTTQIGMAALVSGTATFDAGSSLSGSNSITAQYGGNTKFATGTSSVLTQTVGATTTTTLTSNENPSQTGDDVVFTAMVTGNDGAGDVPSGNVEFFDGGTDLGGGTLDSTGTATFDTTGSLALGAHTITAQYQGDTNFAASPSNTLTQTVNQPQFNPNVTASTLPKAIIAGAIVKGTITVALTNHTASAVTAEKVTVFASSNGSITGAATVISETFKHALSVAPGQTVTVKLTVKAFRAALANATYQLLAQVSSSLNQASSSSGPSLTVAAAFVQLAGVGATGVVKPSTVTAGKPATLTITLNNAGNVESGTAAVSIGLSTDGQTESTQIQTLSAPTKIKPGKSGALHLHLKIPSSVAAGTYHVFVTITAEGDTTTVIGPAFTVKA